MKSDFTTNDILLGASLLYYGFVCEMRRSTDGLFVFEFSADDEEHKKKMDEVVKMYWEEQLSVEPRRFNSLIRGLKADMKK